MNGHFRWHFAYNCIAEDIKRRKLEWSWQHIVEHRKMCRKYSELYEVKLISKRISSGTLEELTNLEKKLNVFNILLLREQAYVHVERSNFKKADKSSNSGWFSSWFNYGAATKPDPNENELGKDLIEFYFIKFKTFIYVINLF